MSRNLSLVQAGLEACVSALVEALAADGLAVAPTDTLPGLLCRWSSPAAVERLYLLKQRSPDKPLIALCHDVVQVASFCASPVPTFLEQYWPGPLSVVLPAAADHPLGWPTQAFRVPDSALMRQLVLRLGEPVFAPSANREGQPPSLSGDQARACFGGAVDLYIDGPVLDGDVPASTLLDCTGTTPVVLRQGAVRVAGLYP